MKNATAQAPAAAQVAEALAGIRADFVDGLIPMINEIEYQRLALQDANQATPALDSLQRTVHKISGMAGSVGFSELGDHASQIDMALAQMRRNGHTSRQIAALEAPLEDLMDLMEEALDAAA